MSATETGAQARTTGARAEKTGAAAAAAARIADAFASARGRAALMPYLMGGYPTLEESLRDRRSMRACGRGPAGAGDALLGPLRRRSRDPRRGHAGARGGGERRRGAGGCARAVGSVPVVLMCYANMVLAPGADAFVARLAQTGACGLIVPDLPLEESAEIRAACDAHGLALVPLVAPTTTPERMAAIGAAGAQGFLYTVSVVGTTGERAPSSLSERFGEILARARASTEVPVALGFGIGTPEQARAAADAGADGVIVGTRLVRAAGDAPDDPAGAVGAVVAELAGGLR